MSLTDTLSHRPGLTRVAPVVFTATIFLSAGLLFFVQPLFAKIVLPEIGGAAAVWTTAMLFFQTVLLAGYLYAHLITRYLPVGAQVAVHLGVWGLGLFFLPLAIPEGWTWTPGQPAAWQTLTLFALGVGVPFAALSANAPLIQAWYARSGGAAADDPYFLYGASNLGSLIALLGFPLVAEPVWGTSGIGAGFAAGYAVLGAGLLAAGLMARGEARRVARASSAPLPWRRIGLWLVLAFVPSSLMLAVTTKISTDIGAIPLVWAVPLSLYLLSFVLTFRARPILPLPALRLATIGALALLGAVFLGVTGGHQKLGMIIAMAAAFFAVALFAHRRLYEARPEGAHLTGFYLAMSVGGALGGLFNSVLAPALFDTLAEGPVTLAVAAALLLSPRAFAIRRRRAVLAWVLGSAAGFTLLFLSRVAPQPELVAKCLLLVTALVLLLSLRARIGAALLALAAFTWPAMQSLPDDAVFRDRSFFGVHKVDEDGFARSYTNGTTLHGAQILDEPGKPTPLSYYHAGLPLAELVTSPVGRSARDVGIVGLGVGAMACHAAPGQNWQYYEIDPVVARIATDPDLFTYLSDCTPDAPVHLGDARMVLERQDQTYDVLVIDAYSSDAVPVHLTTTEAMQLYLDRLNPGGLLIYHISNRYYDLTVPLGRSASALGLAGAHRHDRPEVDELNAHASSVVALARDPGTLASATAASDWQALLDDGGREWTDDHANLLGLLLR